MIVKVGSLTQQHLDSPGRQVGTPVKGLEIRLTEAGRPTSTVGGTIPEAGVLRLNKKGKAS